MLGSLSAPRTTFQIDFAGLMQRAVALHVTPAVIAALQVRGAQLFYLTQPVQLISGDLLGAKSALHSLDLSTPKDRVVLEDLDNFSL